MTAFFAGIVAIAKAIPAVERLLNSFVVFYVGGEIKRWKAGNASGIVSALESDDTIKLEKAVGNPHAGEISGNPGTVIISGPPRT